MAEIKIVKEDDAGRGGRYVARIAGIDGEAEITFTRRGADLISADHTGAPETLGGTRAAAPRVGFKVEEARPNGVPNKPLFPEVRAPKRKNPDWADVMTPAPGEEPDLAKLRTRQAD
jgi:predicted GNAT family acetyltransferase